MDPVAERVALDAAARAGVVPAALVQHALARQAAAARAGAPVSAVSLVAERLPPEER